MILSLAWTFLGAVCQCACLCCCYKSIKRKRNRPASQCQKTWAIFWVIFIYIAFLVGALTSFTGGSLFDTSIASLGDGVVGTLKGAMGVVDALVPAISATFEGLEVIVSTAIDSTTNSVNFNALVDRGVNSNLETLALSFEWTQGNVTALLANGVSVQTAKATLKTSIDGIVADVNTISTSITSWSDSAAPLTVPSPGSGTYYLTNGVSVSGLSGLVTTIQNSIDSAPDGATQLAPLSTMPDMNAFAAQIRSVITALNVNVKAAIQSAGIEVKNNVNPALRNAKSGIVDSISSMQTSVDSSVNPLIVTVDEYIVTTKGFAVYRAYAMIALSSIVILILLIQALLFAKKKGRAVKGCNLCITPFYILIQFMTIFLFIFALVFGDVCASIFEFSPPPIINALDASLGKTITQVFDARDRCVAEQSLIQIASEVGLVNASTVDVKKLASDKINEIDFSGLATNFNVSSAVSLTDSPTNQLSALVNLDLSGLTTSSLDSLTTSLDNLDTQLSNLKTTLTSLSSGLAAGQLTFNPSSPSAATQTAAVDDLKARIAVVVALIDGLRPSGKIATGVSGTASFSTSITNLQSTAQTLKVF